MRRMTAARRGGFTLIELLTVIGILALLAALATAAFLRVRGSQEVGATEATLQKLKSGLDKRWKAVIDDAAEDSTKGRIPQPVITFAGGDKDRARVIWTYCKLKNEFPTTIAEACNPVMGGVLPSKSVFLEGFRKQIQPISPASVPSRVFTIVSTSTALTDIAVESAACFQWALTGTAVRGETFDADGTAQQTGEAEVEIPVTYTYGDPAAPSSGTGKIVAPRVFKDAWGKPIIFVRQTYLSGEVDRTPYTKAAKLQDPVDPQGRLVTQVAGVWDTPQLTAVWNALNLAPGRHIDYDGVSFPTPPANAVYRGTVAPAPSSPGAPDGRSAQNWVPTLISAGSSKKFWFDPEEATNFGAGDDLFSFRLGRDGKGN